ncbi:hypothetical protein BPTFM16_02105 [Altererythrobacter insulae]|nr:hypothetical protein BPTFM16_02105 [Altererythrobacter insulae]
MRLPGLILATMLTCGGASALTAQDKPAEDKVIVSLTPASPWHISFNDGLCRLGRKFEHQAQEHMLIFEQRWPSDEFDLTAIGPALENVVTRSDTSLRFSTTQVQDHKTPAFRQDIAGWGPAALLVDARLPTQASEPDDRLNSISISSPGIKLDTQLAQATEQVGIIQDELNIVFETGSLADPFAVLNDCTQHVLSTWGLDPKEQNAISSKSTILNENSVARRIQESYPSQALRNEEEGQVNLAVIVGSDGQVTDCLILKSSGSNALDRGACLGMLRAEFAPATNAEDESIASYYTTKITYSLSR